MSAIERNPLSLGRRARPTKAHRPVLWETMLTAVAARDADTGRVAYFDLDWAAALDAIGVDPDRLDEAADLDLRVARIPAGVSYSVPAGCSPRAGQLALWAVTR